MDSILARQGRYSGADIVREIKATQLHSHLLKAANAEVTKPNVKISDLKHGLISELTKTGWEKKLRNAVYQYMQNLGQPPHPAAAVEHIKEPVSYIRKAQVTWEKRILKSLNSMCTELGVPLARKRPEKDQKEMSVKWAELGTEEPELTHFRPVYAPKDFLEVIAAMKNPNIADAGDTSSNTYMWGIVQVALPVKDLNDFRVQFSEMSINNPQCGSDDVTTIMSEQFDNERNRLAKKVISANHGPLAQEFLKRGSPTSFRSKVWCQILNIQVEDIDVLYYEQLKGYVLQHDLLVDNLVFKDVKLTTVNDDQYFVFEDYIYQILLPFSRDAAVLNQLKNRSATPAKSFIRGKLGMEEFAVNYPPSGIIPFHGFSMYVSPLCYAYDDPVMLYYVFREIYVRYFSKLHSLSSDAQGIVSLCRIFEVTLQGCEPLLFYHLVSRGIQPLRIAFKWLIRAFSGYLAAEQVLLLWDRVLAYNSLEILPILAVAIFQFRKTNLLQVQTFSAAEGVMADISQLRVIPLLQLVLFTH